MCCRSIYEIKLPPNFTQVFKMQDSFPILSSCNVLSTEYSHLTEIKLNSSSLTIGRGLQNMLRIPFVSISRNHCKLTKCEKTWILEDLSSLGITVNNEQIGKGNQVVLSHGDTILMEPSKTFEYTFLCEYDGPTTSKRMRLDQNSNKDDLFKNLEKTFEKFQNNEIRYLEEKILNTNKLISTNTELVEQIHLNGKRKIDALNTHYTSEIEKITGDTVAIKKQKVLLNEKKNTELTLMKINIQEKSNEIKGQIQDDSIIESSLQEKLENLKKKLDIDKKQLLSDKEIMVEQDFIRHFSTKINEKNEERLKENINFGQKLRKKKMELKLEKDKELQEVIDQNKLMEKTLKEELANIKKNVEEQVERAENEKKKAQIQLNKQIEAMKNLENKDKAMLDQLRGEKEEMEKKLIESNRNADKLISELKERVSAREVELAALAAERIQKQADQSSEVIHSLQTQLEKVRNELQSVENEKNALLKDSPSTSGECSKQLGVVGDIMESELQCSICAELFISPATLNCSHSFCKYCIATWRKKKNDCPICRTPITSECKSLALESFIEKMVERLSPEMKEKRNAVLDSRKEVVDPKPVLQEKRRTRRRNFFEEEDEDEDFMGNESVEEEEQSSDFGTLDTCDSLEFYDYYSGSDL